MWMLHNWKQKTNNGNWSEQDMWNAIHDANRRIISI